MGDRDNWLKLTLNHVCPYAPRRWFERQQEINVFVSAYRVHRVPLKGKFSKRPLVADFERVRTVFVQWDASYQNTYHNLVEQPSGQLDMQLHALPLHRTGNGVLLLLMTPLPDNFDGNGEDAARNRVSFIRSVMVALIGRNAAYKHEFDAVVECGNHSVANPSPVFTSPADETPEVNEEGVALVGKALNQLSSLDVVAQNRIRLALRWYQRSFGDNRLVQDIREGQVDDFINCWLALETLAMEGTTNIAPIRNMLAEIHGLDVQQAGETFPIGRIYRLRGDILHNGQIQLLKHGLTRFMTDVFADLLLHVLGLPSGENTRRYLDGSARALV